jgi:hypothetical protein
MYEDGHVAVRVRELTRVLGEGGLAVTAVHDVNDESYDNFTVGCRAGSPQVRRR